MKKIRTFCLVYTEYYKRSSLFLNIVLIPVLDYWSLLATQLKNTYMVLQIHYFMFTVYRLLKLGIPNDIKSPFYSILGDRQLTRSINNKYFVINSIVISQNIFLPNKSALMNNLFTILFWIMQIRRLFKSTIFCPSNFKLMVANAGSAIDFLWVPNL